MRSIKAGYVFFDFSLAVVLPAAVTSDRVDVAKTKAILKKAISEPLKISESLVTITKIFLGSRTQEHEVAENRFIRHHHRADSESNELYADSIIGVEVHDDDQAAADGTLVGGAQELFHDMSDTLTESISSGDLTGRIQEAASVLDADSPLVAAALDTEHTTVQSANGFSYGTSSDPSQAIHYTVLGVKASGGMLLGVGAGIAVVAIGGLAGMYIYKKRIKGKKNKANKKQHSDIEPSSPEFTGIVAP